MWTGRGKNGMHWQGTLSADNLVVPDVDLTPYWKSNGSSTATGNWNLGTFDLTTTGTLQTGIAGINRAPIANAGLAVTGGSAGTMISYQGADYASGVGGVRFFGYDDLSANDIAFGIDQYGHGRLTFNGGSAKYFAFSTANGDIIFSTGGTARTVALQPGANGDATFFEEATTGEIQTVRVYGFPTGEALRYGQLAIGVDNAFWITSDTGTISFDNENLFTDGNLEVWGNSNLRGASNVLVLPTADPGVENAIWNNGGVLAISAG